ncbi:RNA 2',3'-cyclic phosphodiesterase [Chitinimonas sp.]|uniref:RNA 2',3'-cyclic phosphodiesterase n=1 Tax=Chitinimonas sp. TaxID=1934313 RepID=UPI002F91F807
MDSRLFLALWPDEASRRRFYALGGRLVPDCGGRRMAVDKLHLTLAFLGPVAEAQRLALQQALARVVPTEGVLRLDRLGYWQPGIIWLGMETVPDFLAEQAAALRTVLDGCGVDYDRKPFKAHVTLLRQAARPARWPAFSPLVWQARGFCLVESRPGEPGSPYRVLQHFG